MTKLNQTEVHKKEKKNKQTLRKQGRERKKRGKERRRRGGEEGIQE